MSEPFQLVERRKKKRKRHTNHVDPSFEGRCKAVAQDIGHTSWMTECQIKTQMALEVLGWLPSELFALCLGLGSPMASRTSVAQLTFLILICDALGMAREKVTLFDPHFSQEDIGGLREMGFNIPAENKLGRYTLHHKTLVFMPHCGLELYENLLRQNWTPETLRRFLLIGNNLAEYATSTPASKLEQRTPCLSRLWRYLHLDPIAPLEAYPSSFNNIALQYCNVELILKDNALLEKLPPCQVESMEIM